MAVITAREKLIRFQERLPTNPSADRFLEEEALCNALVKALNIEEGFLKQKPRINWLDKGDGNILSSLRVAVAGGTIIRL